MTSTEYINHELIEGKNDLHNYETFSSCMQSIHKSV